MLPRDRSTLCQEQWSLRGGPAGSGLFPVPAEGEAFVDLAIVGLCSELLFCKKGSCEAAHAKGFTSCLEEKQQFRLWKSPPGAVYGGSKGKPAVRMARRAAELPFPAHHDAWSLGSRQKGREVAEPG